MKKRSIFLSLLICLAAAFFACGIFAISNTKDKGQTVTAQAETPVTQNIYWGVSGTTLTLSASDFSGAQSFDSSTEFSSKTPVPWYSNKQNIKTVVIASKIAPKSTKYWFDSFSNLTAVNSIQNLDTSNVTTMSCMFQSCTSLTTVDVSHFDISNVKDMMCMFLGCPLTTLDISSWGTSKVEDVTAMFAGCKSLESLDLKNFDATHVTSIVNMFNSMPLLKKVRLSNSLVQKMTSLGEDAKLTFPLYDCEGNIYNSVSELTSGGGYFTTPHTHDYQFTSSTATCTEAGEELYTCSEPICGFTKTESADALGHNTTKVEAVKVTCTTNGRHEHYVCSRCNQLSWDNEGNSPCTASDVVINQLQHDIKDTVTAPTCLTGGSTKHTCQREGCGYEYTDSYTDALGHDWGSWTNNDNAATHIRECNNCDETETELHTFPDGWVTDSEATEEAAGSKHRDCTVCGYRQSETIQQLNHTHKYDSWTPEAPANCTETGTKGHYTCTCGLHFDENHDEISDLTIAAKEHSFNDWHQTKQATEEAEGEQQRECQRDECDEVETKSIPKLNHVHVEVIDEAVDPTCATEGKTEGKHCSGCDTVIVEQQTLPALGHDWADEWSNDETNHWHVCSRCDEKYSDEAHTYDWVITVEPTEEAEGLKEKKCTVCGHKDGEEVIAKLVVDDNGNVSDLPPDHDYDLEIAVKESESKYNISGVNKGYVVELYVVDGENRNPYDSEKSVILKLVIPDGMDEFTLYRMSGDRLTEVAADEYKVEGGMLSIRTTLPDEFVFNSPAPEEPAAEIPWWVWLIVGLVAVAIAGVVIIIIVVIKKKNGGDGGTTVVQGTQYDDAELKAKLSAQDRKLDEIKEIVDGGFNDVVDD